MKYALIALAVSVLAMPATAFDIAPEVLAESQSSGSLDFVLGQVELIPLGEPVEVTHGEVASWLARLDGNRSAAQMQDVMAARGRTAASLFVSDVFRAETGFVDKEGVVDVLERFKIREPEADIVETVIALIGGITEGREVTCSGGSATVSGWADDVVLLGSSHNIQNTFASAHYTIVYETGADGEVLSIDGYTRSPMDNIVWEFKAGSRVVYWDWLSVPMGGSASLGFSCLRVGGTGLLTSVAVGVSGLPLVDPDTVGLPPDTLAVNAHGTTCFIPC